MFKTYDFWYDQFFIKKKSIKQISKECEISYYTGLKYFKKYFKIQDLDHLLKLADHVDDLKTLISHKNKNDQKIINEIINKTNFITHAASLGERLYYIKNQIQKPPVCSNNNCNNTVKWNKNTKKFNNYCSNTCIGNDTKIQQKKILTCNNNFGCDYPSQNNKVKQKYKQTMKSRYGYDFINQHNINKETYDILNNKHQLQNLYNTLRTTYNVASYLNVSQSLVSKKGIEIGIITNNNSGIEQEICDYIEDNTDFTIQTNNRKIIPPQEIDIYIEDLNLAFEINGVYWHSELCGKDKNYHLTKTNECNKKGIRLVHIFDTEWTEKNKIVKSRINNLLFSNNIEKIYARKCSIVVMNSKEANAFMENNHIQGSRNCNINYGLKYDGKIVACMTFSKPRFNKKFEYELIRYANLINTTVIGGASKIFSHFQKVHNPTNIITYSDKRWNTGKLYHNLGFKYMQSSAPNYFYFGPYNRNYNLKSRTQFQKHKLKNKLEHFDPKLTEWKNMQLNGYNRIWDCGNDVYIWENF